MQHRNGCDNFQEHLLFLDAKQLILSCLASLWSLMSQACLRALVTTVIITFIITEAIRLYRPTLTSYTKAWCYYKLLLLCSALTTDLLLWHRWDHNLQLNNTAWWISWTNNIILYGVLYCENITMKCGHAA